MSDLSTVPQISRQHRFLGDRQFEKETLDKGHREFNVLFTRVIEAFIDIEQDIEEESLFQKYSLLQNQTVCTYFVVF